MIEEDEPSDVFALLKNENEILNEPALKVYGE